MKYYIYKLKFTTSVRFGERAQDPGKTTCSADTFFSALCNGYLALFGEEEFKSFIHSVQDDQFFISDLLPYKHDELYIPKPKLYLEKKDEESESEPSATKKEFKKLNFIPISKFDDYVNFLKGAKKEFKLTELMESFGSELDTTRVAIPRDLTLPPLPYMTSSFKFKKDCGLYLIIKTTETIIKQMDKIIDYLGAEGIGGKRSSGLGKFTLYEDKFEPPLYESDEKLNAMLEGDGDYYIALSPLIPEISELEKIDEKASFYTLKKRSGFIYSDNYSNTFLKKKDCYVFEAGSSFSAKMKGLLLDVSDKTQGTHSVYRYGKALYLGVKI